MTTHRRAPLEPLSPNRPLLAPLPTAALSHLKTSSNVPLTSSPLKRSFTALAEEGRGLRYLGKRRRVSTFPEVVVGGGEYFGVRELGVKRTEGEGGRGTDVVVRREEEEQHADEDVEDDDAERTEPNTPESDNNGERTKLDVDVDAKPPNPNPTTALTSFSSLITYNPPSSSTSSQQYQQRHRHHRQEISRAELLRLRLRVAMYKVRTNQTGTPLKELLLVENQTPPLSDMIAPAPTTTKTTTMVNVEQAVAALRDGARREQQQLQANSALVGGKGAGDEKNPSSSSSLFPKGLNLLQHAPVLKPTVYSSRQIVIPAYPRPQQQQLSPSPHLPLDRDRVEEERGGEERVGGEEIGEDGE